MSLGSSPWTLVRGLALCVFAIGALGVARELGAQSPPDGGLDRIVLDYETAFGSWLGQILTVTMDLFFWLALIEFVIAGIMYTVATPETRAGTTGRFLIKIILISFVYMLITESHRWLFPLINSFIGVGEYVTGQTLSPSEIVGYGVDMSRSILESVGAWGMLQNPPVVIYMSIGALVVLFSYGLIAAQVVLTLVHSYLLLSVGLFFLAFAAFRATASFAENYLMGCAFVGIKLMLLYFLVAVGDALTQSWVVALRSGTTDFATEAHIIVGVVTFAFIVWYIPNKVASQITGGASFGLAEAMRRTS
jgi:type IV secretion system protein TrbL